jgi:hypothetical protein
MKTIARSHGPDGSDLRKRYQYLLLEQVWRDASSDPWTWEDCSDKNATGAQFRNKGTGVAIRCEMHDGGNTFTLTETVDVVPGRSSVREESEVL